MRRVRRAIVAALFLVPVSFTNAVADPNAGTIPAGTRLQFFVTAPISSNESKTGAPFAFVLSAPLVVGDLPIAANGAMGAGTIYLAGHAGTAGHEGDLTLRIDSLQTSDGRVVTFTDQRFEINGRNRKIMSSVLGFVPYVGLGSYFIRGSEARIDTTTPIETVLLHPATIAAAAAAGPSPTPAH